MPLNVNVSAPTYAELNPSVVVFRDPKVMFHASTASWIAAISGGDHIQLHRSTDLIHWSLVSRFGYEQGSHAGIWECPDLIEFPHKTGNNQTTFWVLIVSIDRNAIAGGSGIQYFIGTFDGLTFQNLQSPETINWLDYGPDFYAGIIYHNVPRYDGRQIMISWMNNWQYAQDVPTAPLWRGQMAMPRQLQLDFNSFTNAYHLRQSPVHELHSYSKQLFTFHRQTLTSSSSNILSNTFSDTFMLFGEFHNITKTSIIRLRVQQSSDKKEYTEIKYIGEKNEIELDRSHSGNTDFHPQFHTHYNMTLDQETPTTRVLKLQVLVDRLSVEIFVNDGKYTMTALIFPKAGDHGMELSVGGQEILLNSLELMLISV
jgi:fructan beta-fructosidase